MFTNEQDELYQKISKVCRICIPFLYFLITVSIFALFFVPFALMTDNDAEIIINNVTVDASTLSEGSKYLIIIALTAMLALAIRMLWLITNILKRFKNREIFSDDNAKLAYKVAMYLLLILIGKLALGLYISVLLGDLSLDFSELGTLAFAYLSAWILNIGSQLKTENDLTV